MAIIDCYLSTIRDEKNINKDGLVFGVSRHFQQYLSFIVAVSFIGGGNQSTRRKPLTCRRSQIKIEVLGSCSWEIIPYKNIPKITLIILKEADKNNFQNLIYFIKNM